jgi:hypothetical protein
LENNYNVKSLDRMKDAVKILNGFNLTSEEKFRILNFKPKNLVELLLVRKIF